MQPARVERSTVLVTGAAGFIGASLVDRLLQAGHKVLALDKGKDKRHRRVIAELPAAHWLSIDMADADLRSLVSQVDIVVHLAAQPGVQTSWGNGFGECLRANVLQTQQLLEAVADEGAGRVVLASSSSVYGEIGSGLAREQDSLHPVSPYGVSKVACEQLMGAYAAKGVEAVALRFFTAYGRRQRSDMALFRIIDAALGGPEFLMRGEGNQARDFTHVYDIVRAIEAAMFTPDLSGTVFNIGTGSSVTLNDLIEHVERIVDKTVPVRRVPPASGDPARTAADTQKARNLLDWTPTVSLQDGITDQISYQVGTISAPAAIWDSPDIDSYVPASASASASGRGEGEA